MQVHITGRTDEELVLLYKQTNNKAAVGELFKRHSLMCFTVCMKYLKNEDDAHDATMAVFEQLFSDLVIHEVRNFRNWLHSVCRNHCFMQLRKPKQGIRLHDVTGERETGTFFMESDRFMHQDDNTAEKEAKLQVLEEAITGLKDRQRECIELFYLKMKSYEEIAASTGYSPNEVKSHIQNGRRNLKLILGGKGITMGILLYIWIHQAV